MPTRRVHVGPQYHPYILETDFGAPSRTFDLSRFRSKATGRKRVSYRRRTPQVAGRSQAPQQDTQQVDQAQDDGYDYDYGGGGDYVADEELLPEAIQDQHADLGGASEPVSRPDRRRNAAVVDELWEREGVARAAELLAAQTHLAEHLEAEKRHRHDVVTAALSGQGRECRKCHRRDCITDSVRTCRVIVIGLEFAFSAAVPVFSCTSCKVDFAPSPFKALCYPGSPIHAYDLLSASGTADPVWVELSLMRHMDGIREACPSGLSYDWWAQFLHGQYRKNACDRAIISEERLRKALTVAHREHMYTETAMERMVETMVEAVVPRAVLAECAICSHLATESGRVHSLGFDFTFKLVHYTTEQGICYPAPPNRSLFIDNAQIHALDNLPRGCQPVDSQECSNFKADQVLGRKKKKCDITALGVCCCRHGHILRFMNCFTGERHAYCLAFTQWLAKELKLGVDFIWYDINCKWKATFEHWMQSDPEVLALLRETKCPLPVFHLKAHSSSCQEENGHVYMEGAGRSYGEAVEQINSQSKRFSASTPYMTARHREALLENFGRTYNNRREHTLPELVLRMAVCAEHDLAKAVETAKQLQAALLDLGLDENEIAEGLRVVVEGRGRGRAPSPLGPGAAYAKAVLINAWADKAIPSSPQVELLLEGFSPGSKNARVIREARHLLSRGDRQHTAQPGSEAFTPLLAELLEAEVLNAVQRLEHAACCVHVADFHMTRLSGRPGEQSRVKKHKLAEKEKITAQLALMTAWLACMLVADELLPERVRQMRISFQEPQGKPTAEDVLAGRYPWLFSSSTACQLSGEMYVLLHRLRTAKLQIARCEEELALIGREKVAAVSAYASRQEAIELAVQQCSSRLQTLGESAEGDGADAAPHAASAMEAQHSMAAHAGPRPVFQQGALDPAPLREGAALQGTVLLLKKSLTVLKGLRAVTEKAFRQATHAEGLRVVRYEAGSDDDAEPEGQEAPHDDTDTDDSEDSPPGL